MIKKILSSFLFFLSVVKLSDAAKNLGLRNLQDSPPEISGRAPIAGDIIRESTVLLMAEVTDDVGIRNVQFRVIDPNGNVGAWTSGSEDSSGSGLYVLPVTLPEDGRWQWQVKARELGSERKQTVEPRFDLNVIITAAGALQAARRDIENIIDATPELRAKFVRLGFHDCVGGCDGCVDLENGDNGGLDIPITALAPIVSKFADAELGVSRADIWAYSALIGADESQNLVDFPMNWVGRQDCEIANIECLDENNVSVPCSSTRGPHRSLPSPNLDTADLLHFFASEFDFSAQETVAIMGAHSIGSLSRENSGFDGPNGWVFNNRNLDSGYYAQLIGGNSSDSPLEDLLFAPDWTMQFTNNTDVGTPDRFSWFHQRPGDETPILMLDSDIALVRNFTDYLDTETGEVTCDFRCRGRCNNVVLCPFAGQTFDFMVDYKFDNLLFLNDFRDAFSKMLVKGYDATGPCIETETPCVLGLPQ